MNTASVTVRLTPADYASAERYVAESLRRRGRWYWPVRAIGVAIGFLLVFGFIGLFTYEPHLGSPSPVQNSAFMLLSAVALVGVVAHLHRRSITGVLFAPGSKLLQPFTLVVTHAGVELQSPSGTATLPWASLLRIELEGNQLFIFTQPNYALVVPAHAFASRAELASFAQMLEHAKNGHAA